MEEEPLQEGSITRGILFGCLFQFAFLVFGVLVGPRLVKSTSGKLTAVILASWGVTQWIAIGPMIWRERAKGYSKTATGLIIIGCIGLLLSSGCAMLFIR